jgi:peptide/nickel transport system permease protein
MGTERDLRSLADQSGATDAGQRKPILGRITTQSRWYWVRLLLENPAALAGLAFLLIILIATMAFPRLSPNELVLANPAVRLQPPSGEFWMGTDQFGRDVLLRGVYGVRVSLMVGAAVMVISAFIGTIIGLMAGYYQRLDTVIMRIMDGIMAFPPILLAIALMASLGPSTPNVIVALGLVYMPVIARLVRGSTLSTKEFLYVEAARSIGVRDHSILARHIFPNVMSPLIVQCTFIVAFSIIAEASLSFLGAGVPPDVPTWGSMLRDGQEVITRAWWMVVVPGTLMFLTILALNLVGDGLRDALDPRARGR